MIGETKMKNKENLKRIIMEERTEYTKLLNEYSRLSQLRNKPNKETEEKLYKWQIKLDELCEIYKAL